MSRKEDTELVSIVVPVYKCEKYIDKCIKSIINQTYQNIEIILVLDGDFDNSREICRNYRFKDSRIKLINKENEGVSVARNYGIDAVEGEWIGFVDSDDWIDPNYVKRLLSLAKDERADIAICGYYTERKGESKPTNFFTFEERNFIKEEHGELIKNCLVCTEIGNKHSTTNVGVPWAKLYRKSFVEDHNIRFVPGLRRMQDTIFNLYAYHYADKIVYRNWPLYHYTKNESASTSSYMSNFNKTAEQFIGEVNKYIDYTNDRSLTEVLDAKTLNLIIEMIKLQFVPDGSSVSHKVAEMKNIIYSAPYIKAVYSNSGKYLSSKKQCVRILLKMRMVRIVYFYVKKVSERQRSHLIDAN